MATDSLYLNPYQAGDLFKKYTFLDEGSDDEVLAPVKKFKLRKPNLFPKVPSPTFKIVQIEDAKKTTKLVRRDITRIITPGTATDAGMLDAGRNNYLGAVITKDDRAGFAYVDISTGEFRMTELPPQEVNAALDQIDVREILEPVEASLFADRVPENNTGNGERLKTKLESWVFDLDYSERTLCSHFKLHSIDGLGAKNHPIALSAAGAILHSYRTCVEMWIGKIIACANA